MDIDRAPSVLEVLERSVWDAERRSSPAAVGLALVDLLIGRQRARFLTVILRVVFVGMVGGPSGRLNLDRMVCYERGVMRTCL